MRNMGVAIQNPGVDIKIPGVATPNSDVDIRNSGVDIQNPDVDIRNSGVAMPDFTRTIAIIFVASCNNATVFDNMIFDFPSG